MWAIYVQQRRPNLRLLDSAPIDPLPTRNCLSIRDSRSALSTRGGRFVSDRWNIFNPAALDTAGVRCVSDRWNIFNPAALDTAGGRCVSDRWNIFNPAALDRVGGRCVLDRWNIFNPAALSTAGRGVYQTGGIYLTLQPFLQWGEVCVRQVEYI